MPDTDAEPIPWWLVPNVLALDAPLVAVVWQRFLAARFGVPVPWTATLALAATVWGVYLADRVFDARTGAVDADRHRVTARHPRAFLIGCLLATGVAVASATWLPARYLWLGGLIGGGVAAYLALVHLAAGSLERWPGAKELLVGIGFAAGVSIPLAADERPVLEWLPTVVAFGGLCWLNCRLIDCWERPPRGRSVTVGDGVLAAVLVFGSLFLPFAIGLSIATATIGLAAVHLGRRRSPRPARVLADVVLLTPLAFGWMS